MYKRNKNIFKVKSQLELDRIPSKRLLLYYKAERQRFISYKNGLICECCGEFNWDINVNDTYGKEEYENRKEYLEKIKNTLSNREHIKK